MTIEPTADTYGKGWRITQMIDGRYISRLYIGYTRMEAIKKFMSTEY